MGMSCVESSHVFIPVNLWDLKQIIPQGRNVQENEKIEEINDVEKIQDIADEIAVIDNENIDDETNTKNQRVWESLVSPLIVI